ncbi:MAG: radical SAM protein [Dehalococcoidia bacterium]|nr:radical SAM protein [Dehalococcoidia bacterium]
MHVPLIVTRPFHAAVDDFTQLRPFAARNMIYRDVRVRGQPMVFAIDPWTQRWCIISSVAKRLMDIADGRILLSDIAAYLSSFDNAIGYRETAQLESDLRGHGLVFLNEEEHRASGGSVYRKTDLVGLHLEITNACNLRCAHCYVSSGKELPSELSTEEILRVIDQLPSFCGKRIAISGGEPTLRRDCAAIIEYCTVTCGHHVDLCTNGIRFPQELSDQIIRLKRRTSSKIRIQVSLEGARAETNDLVRGDGSFNATMKTLDMFKSSGLNRSAVLFVCVTKQNIHEIERIIALAESCDVAMLVFSQWQRQGNAANVSWDQIGPSTEDWVKAGELLLQYRGPRLQVFGNFFGDLSNNAYGRYSLNSPLFPKHIYSYNAVPRMAPDGAVFADQLWVDKTWSLGNIREHTLEELFDSPRFYAQLEVMKARTSNVEDCKKCPWSSLCECGSPGHTYSEYGRLDGKDVFCESRKYWFERFVQHCVSQADAIDTPQPS